uniref:FERM domain-containing protein n=1 Tax=Ditylenchus dipsaci TaxID=166011 RepID=A0A915EKK1_9BILA
MNEENRQSSREQMVSLAEIIEVRDEAVSHPLNYWLYWLLLANSYVLESGSIKICFCSLNQASKDFIPPELKRIVEEDPSAADSLLIGDAQLVWCLGQVASHASLPNFLDVGLFSLLNLMTVEHVASRPSLSKLSQMLRNKIQNVEDMPAILVQLYQELMGDIDELIDDKFCDDIRFSSTRSSLSIVSGAGTPLSTKQLQTTVDEYDRQKTLIEDYLIPASRSGPLDNEDDKTDVEEDATQPIAKFNAQAKEMPHTRFIKKSSTTTHTSLSRKSRESSGSSTAVDEEDSLNPFNEVPRVKQQAPNHSGQWPNKKKWTPLMAVVVRKDPMLSLCKWRKQPTPQSAKSNNHIQPTAQSTPLGGASGGGQQSYNNNSMADSIEPFEKIDLPPDMLPSPVNQQEVNDESDYMDCMPSVKPAPAAQHLDQLNFSRQNSLQPSKVQRRSSSRRVSNTYKSSSPSVAIPEFLEKNSMPLIRLRAQSIKKKKVTLHRAENSMVVVKLLNGQCVEVNCRTDAYVSNVFDTVAAHLNITEHIFFGLAMLQNSEYFSWTMTIGWRNQHHLDGRIPKFIKTETTTHNLYLQLRQDMLSGSLRFEINKAIELAAIALQAEYGDHNTSKQSPDQLDNGTNSSQYFKLVNYLPSKFYPSIDENPCETEAQIVGQHSKFAGLGRVEAERLFIQSCQAELGYGAHYYRVYKIKPSTKNPYYNRYSDVHLIAVMPYGMGFAGNRALAIDI